jgi:hypothetical protein
MVIMTKIHLVDNLPEYSATQSLSQPLVCNWVNDEKAYNHSYFLNSGPCSETRPVEVLIEYEISSWRNANHYLGSQSISKLGNF